MNILVTGGAGFIGSIITEKLLECFYNVIVLDNLEVGHKDAVPKRAIFIQGDIANIPLLKKIFKKYKIETVMHMAADALVEQSLVNPKRYFQNNVVGGIALINTMLAANVGKMIFSSSAAVYGEPKKLPIDETHSTEPINPYGQSKLMYERILNWYQKAYGLKFVTLRYFNAAGASNNLGEDHQPETHLIPNILKAVATSGVVPIFGSDYPTKDGSSIRDFVHVEDIATAHILALEKLDQIDGHTYNLGSDKGYSVFEVIKVAEKITGFKIKIKIDPKRLGDPMALVASSKLARKELGWRPKFQDLKAMIESAWRWYKNHPEGYRN